MIRVAIDGPGGAGKSTVAKEIAKRLCSLIESMQIVDRGIEEEIENE